MARRPLTKIPLHSFRRTSRVRITWHSPIKPRQVKSSQPINLERWRAQNVLPHQQPGYAAVHISLKRTGVAPGDVSDRDLEALADLAERYSFGEARVTHEQNIVLADVEQTKLPDLFEALGRHNLDRANRGLATDMICCPGGDYCSLANAKSIPVAAAIEETFEMLK